MRQLEFLSAFATGIQPVKVTHNKPADAFSGFKAASASPSFVLQLHTMAGLQDAVEGLRRFSRSFTLLHLEKVTVHHGNVTSLCHAYTGRLRLSSGRVASATFRHYP